MLEASGFVIRPRSNQEVMEMLVAGEENRYVRKLINLICRFISNFKVNGYTSDDFNRMYHSTQNVRSRLFLEICNDCFLEYEKDLKENRAIDFQDISRQRFDLTKALSEVTDQRLLRSETIGSLFMHLVALISLYLQSLRRKWDTHSSLKLLKLIAIPKRSLILQVILFKRMRSRLQNGWSRQRK